MTVASPSFSTVKGHTFVSDLHWPPVNNQHSNTRITRVVHVFCVCLFVCVPVCGEYALYMCVRGVYVCMYIYVYVCTHMCVYVYMYVCVYICVVCVYVCSVYVCLCVCDVHYNQHIY